MVRVLPVILMSWVLGVAWQLRQPSLWSWGVYALLLLAAGAAAAAGAHRLRRSAKFAAGAAVVLSLWVGLLAGAGYAGLRATQAARQVLDPALEGVDLMVTGRVATLPRSGVDSDRFEFQVEAGLKGDQPALLPDRLLLSDYQGNASDRRTWRAGDRWRLSVRLRLPHGNANPHGFDRERWLWEQGIGATGYVRVGRGDPRPVLLGSSGLHPVERLRQAIGERIQARVGDSRTAGILTGLVIGDQSAIDRNDWALFRQTGVAHLMAISGLHITLFAWLAMAVVGRCWRLAGRHWPILLWSVPAPLVAGWGGVALAAAYAVLAGWGVPAQRTVLMLALAVSLRLRVLYWPWPLMWLGVMSVVLVLDPWALLQPGFWLSFVAVGVLFASGRQKAAGAVTGWARWPAAALSMLREQWVITLALTPLTLLLFGQVSLAGLLANLLAIPWVTLLVTPLALAGVLLSPLWDVAALAVQGLGLWLAWLAQWPLASVFRPMAPWPLGALAVVGGVLLAQRLPWTFRLAGLLLVWPVLAWVPARPAPGAFEVMAIDVGQGSAVLVRTASHSLLFDTGPRFGQDSDAGDRIVVPLLRALGESPDTVVVSHKDSDHAGGAAAVRAAWPKARWLASFGPDERCVAGTRWTWDAVHFEVLHPAPALYGPGGEGILSSNAMSCVLRVDNGRESAWLSGDLDAEGETRLALARPALRATMMLAPHHGSATSSSPVLLNTLRPSVVLVQSGYRNRFGHPSEVVLQRYRERGLNWVSSPQCGAITWRSETPGSTFCQRDLYRRYWHHGGARERGTMAHKASPQRHDMSVEARGAD